MPKHLEIASPAKINLCIDILEHAPSGYHKLETVFQEIALSDKITIFETDQESDNLSITQGPKSHTTTPEIPQANNLAFQALQLVKNRCKITRCFDIKITKNIPVAAGLGGASSNAATTLKALNELWSLDLSTAELQSLGAELGCDVPFFILGGTALGQNFGEQISPLPAIQGLEFQLDPPATWPALEPLSSKTATMFSRLDLSLCGQNRDKTAALVQAIHDRDTESILANLHNDFETILPPQKGHHLSGSGPATFTARLT